MVEALSTHWRFLESHSRSSEKAKTEKTHFGFFSEFASRSSVAEHSENQGTRLFVKTRVSLEREGQF